MKKLDSYLIGLLQASAVIIYCLFIAGLLNLFGNVFTAPAGLLGSVFIYLVLLVFSAAVTGSIVFGYPAYLFLKTKQAKKSLLILSYTLLYCLAFIIIVVVATVMMGS